MRALAPVILLAALAAGCLVPPKNRVNRAALVPHLTPISSSGAAMAQPVEVRLGASSVAHLQDPEASDPDAAVEVPGTQLQGGLRARIFGAGSLGFVVEYGLDSTAVKGKSTQVPVDHGDVVGKGLTFTAAVPVSGRWSVGVAIEAMIWAVPWVEYAVCVENCEDTAPRSMTEGDDLIGQFAMGLVPTYRGDELTWFGGVTLRNHPTIVQKDEELGNPPNGDVEGGPGNIVLSAGVEAELGLGVRGSVILYAPVDALPIHYGPSLSASVIIPLGARAPRN